METEDDRLRERFAPPEFAPFEAELVLTPCSSGAEAVVEVSFRRSDGADVPGGVLLRRDPSAPRSVVIAFGQAMRLAQFWLDDALPAHEAAAMFGLAKAAVLRAQGLLELRDRGGEALPDALEATVLCGGYTAYLWCDKPLSPDEHAHAVEFAVEQEGTEGTIASGSVRYDGCFHLRTDGNVAMHFCGPEYFAEFAALLALVHTRAGELMGGFA